MKAIDTYLDKLNTIYEDTFLPEFKKGSPFENAGYTNTITEIIELKNSIHPKSFRKRLLYVCQANKKTAELSLNRHWNIISFFSTTAATLISFYALFSYVLEKEEVATMIRNIIIAIAALLLLILNYARRTPKSMYREIFYNLVVEILADDVG